MATCKLDGPACLLRKCHPESFGLDDAVGDVARFSGVIDILLTGGRAIWEGGVVRDEVFGGR